MFVWLYVEYVRVYLRMWCFTFRQNKDLRTVRAVHYFESCNPATETPQRVNIQNGFSILNLVNLMMLLVAR